MNPPGTPASTGRGRYLFDVVHPANSLFFFHTIKTLQAEGADVLVASRHKDVLIPLLETFLLFYLPHLAFRRLKGPAGAALFTALMTAMGWGLHGADVYAIGHGLNFGMLGVWFWTVRAARGARGAVLATTVAHGVWNGLLILAWVLWGRT